MEPNIFLRETGELTVSKLYINKSLDVQLQCITFLVWIKHVRGPPLFQE